MKFTYKQAMLEFRLCFDGGDPWGSVMQAWFGIAGELWHRGELVPPEWEYSPGACDDPREPDDYLFEVFEGMELPDLKKMGDLIHRYAGVLDRAGYSY